MHITYPAIRGTISSIVSGATKIAKFHARLLGHLYLSSELKPKTSPDKLNALI